jgi:hypothetical protein
MSACISPTRCSPIGGGGLTHYFALIAASGAGKGRYIRATRTVVEKISPALVAYQKPRSDVGFYRQLRESPARLFCFEEFSVWLENMITSKVSSQAAIAEALLYCWDCPSIIDGGANKKAIDSTDAIRFPLVNIIAAMTIESYESTSRLKAAKKDGIGGRVEPIIFADFVPPNNDIEISDVPEAVLEIFSAASRETIIAINGHSRTPDEKDPREYRDIVYPKKTPFYMDFLAKEKVNEIREKYSAEAFKASGIMSMVFARTAERILRTACILAAFRASNEINDTDVEFAEMFHVENIAKAGNVIDISQKENIGAEIEERIVIALRSMGRPTKWTDILKADQSLKRHGENLLRTARKALVDSGIITTRRQATIGRPADILELTEWSDRDD